ncbi:MAG TPA: hypothetical protein PK765_02805 [bacterium]|nr:hypothetical protein [bacterium]
MNTPSSWSFRFWLVTIGVLSTLAVVPVSAQSEDTQLIDKENSSSVSGEDVASSFSMQRFESCEDMQERLYDLYSHVSSDSYYGGDYAVDDMMAEGMSAPTKAVDP